MSWTAGGSVSRSSERTPRHGKSTPGPSPFWCLRRQSTSRCPTSIQDPGSSSVSRCELSRDYSAADCGFPPPPRDRPPEAWRPRPRAGASGAIASKSVSSRFGLRADQHLPTLRGSPRARSRTSSQHRCRRHWNCEWHGRLRWRSRRMRTVMTTRVMTVRPPDRQQPFPILFASAI